MLRPRSRAMLPARLGALGWHGGPHCTPLPALELWPPRPCRTCGSATAAAAVAAAFGAGIALPMHAEERKAESSHLEPWQKRWSTGQTGWHLESVHPLLKRFLGELPSASPGLEGMGPRVLLPLCGKTVDMAFLACKGYRVVGVEGVEAPIREFATAHSATGQTVPVMLPPGLSAEHYRAHAVMLRVEGDGPLPSPVLFLEGDFLNLGPDEAAALVPFDAAFDRGGLVAVDPGERRRYAEVLSLLLSPGSRSLLVTVEHDAFADGRLGPPFEVAEPEVHALFDDNFEVRLLLQEDRFHLDAGMRARGCTRFHECTYLLTRRGKPTTKAVL
mmetsp:Transcript_64635/g.179242  ORF Transcript_64635/g.179242 Transcript_64635/m.179242 type:complete len:330 (+) Transcript_64635:55-1044(+)